MKTPQRLSPSAALSLLAPGMRVFVHAGPSECMTFVDAIRADPERARGVEFLGVFIPGVNATDYSALAPDARVAYVMTDGGALPAWFSRTVAQMRDEGLIVSCLTVGQAFGGDLEAVTVHSGLLAARHVVGADVTVVAQGPGNLGTGTRWGFSGVAAGETVNAAATLGGRPVGSLRVSASDARPRHVGVSHHSTTAYGRVALTAADVVVPVLHESVDVPVSLGGPTGLNALVEEQVAALAARHRLVRRTAGAALLSALRRSPVRMSSMGRDLAADPTPFLAAAAAGEHAAALLRG